MKKVEQFLDYAVSQQQAVLIYEVSNMILAVHIDASYLSKSKAGIRAGGHFVMSKDVSFPPNNGAVINIAQIMETIMSLAEKAEIGSMYANSRKAVPAWQCLNEMGHHQPRNPMQTDNTPAYSVVTNNVQPKRTKSMDMRFHCRRCRDVKYQFQ